MVAAALDRIASQSAVTREQEGREGAEPISRLSASTWRIAGRVSMLGELAASLGARVDQPLTAIYTNVQGSGTVPWTEAAALDDCARRAARPRSGLPRAGEVLGRLRHMFRRTRRARAGAVGPLIEHCCGSSTRRREPRRRRRPRRSRDLPLVTATASARAGGDEPAGERVRRRHGRRGTRQSPCAPPRRTAWSPLDPRYQGGISPGDLDRIFEPFLHEKNGMGMGCPSAEPSSKHTGGRIVARNGPSRLGVRAELAGREKRSEMGEP